VTANPPGPQFADTEHCFPRFNCSYEFAKNHSYFQELYEFVPNHWYIFPYYFAKLLDDPEFMSTSKNFNFSIYESIAQSCILYDDLPIQAKFVLTIWTNCKEVEQWYEDDMVDYKQMKVFATNLEFRGGGSQERKVLWLSKKKGFSI
jgi:hypothetical protein